MIISKYYYQSNFICLIFIHIFASRIALVLN